MAINKALLGELKNESANTKKKIERLPVEKLNWRSHEKSMTIGTLTTHIANLPVWFGRIINANGFDFASSVTTEKKETTQAIIGLFTQIKRSRAGALDATSDELYRR